MKQFQKILSTIKNKGIKKIHKGEKIFIFGQKLNFDLSEGFPILTIQKSNFNKSLDSVLRDLRFYEEEISLLKGDPLKIFYLNKDNLSLQFYFTPNLKTDLKNNWSNYEHEVDHKKIPYGKLNLICFIPTQELLIDLFDQISKYSLLLSILSKKNNYFPGELIYMIGEGYIDTTQLEKVNELLLKEPLPSPKLFFIDDDINNVELINYRFNL